MGRGAKYTRVLDVFCYFDASHIKVILFDITDSVFLQIDDLTSVLKRAFDIGVTKVQTTSFMFCVVILTGKEFGIRRLETL